MNFSGYKAKIVVPCYNEAQRLEPDAFLSFAKKFSWLQFLFVDDGSRDETFQLLTNLCEQAPKSLSVMRLEQNSGKAEAVRRGLLAAAESDVQIVGFWDADLAAPLEEIPPMCELFARKDACAVLGARVKLLGHHIEKEWARLMLGRLFAQVAGATLRLAIYDPQCGAKIFRNDESLRYVFAEPFTVKWIFDVEMLARYIAYGRDHGVAMEEKIVEYPLESYIHKKGSKLRRGDFVKAAFDLVGIAAKYHPWRG